MPEDGAAAREFRPNSHAFLAVQGAAAILAIASGLVALSGSSPAQLWIGLVLASQTAVLALRSLRLIVTPDSVMLLGPFRPTRLIQFVATSWHSWIYFRSLCTIAASC